LGASLVLQPVQGEKNTEQVSKYFLIILFYFNTNQYFSNRQVRETYLVTQTIQLRVLAKRINKEILAQKYACLLVLPEDLSDCITLQVRKKTKNKKQKTKNKNTKKI